MWKSSLYINVISLPSFPSPFLFFTSSFVIIGGSLILSSFQQNFACDHFFYPWWSHYPLVFSTLTFIWSRHCWMHWIINKVHFQQLKQIRLYSINFLGSLKITRQDLKFYRYCRLCFEVVYVMSWVEKVTAYIHWFPNVIREYKSILELYGLYYIQSFLVIKNVFYKFLYLVRSCWKVDHLLNTCWIPIFLKVSLFF